jgi:hypothetical protein
VLAVSEAPDTDSHGADGLTDRSDHVYDPVPPVAVNPTLYATPCIPPGSGLVVVIWSGGLIVKLKGCGLEGPTLSVATTLTLTRPDASGVPLITPEAGSILSQVGDPPLNDHVIVPVAPVAVTVYEYGVP